MVLRQTQQIQVEQREDTEIGSKIYYLEQPVTMPREIQEVAHIQHGGGKKEEHRHDVPRRIDTVHPPARQPAHKEHQPEKAGEHGQGSDKRENHWLRKVNSIPLQSL